MNKNNLGSISNTDLIDAKLEEHQLCGSKQCPGCGHKLEAKPVRMNQYLILIITNLFLIFLASAERFSQKDEESKFKQKDYASCFILSGLIYSYFPSNTY